MEQSQGDLMSSHQREETWSRCRLRKGSLQGARAHLGSRESGKQRRGHEEGMVCGRNEQGMQAVSKRVSTAWLLKRFREQGGLQSNQETFCFFLVQVCPGWKQRNEKPESKGRRLWKWAPWSSPPQHFPLYAIFLPTPVILKRLKASGAGTGVQQGSGQSPDR